MSDDRRVLVARALTKAITGRDTAPWPRDLELADAVLAIRDEEVDGLRAEVAELRVQLAKLQYRRPECQMDLIDIVSEEPDEDDSPITPCGDPSCQCAIIAPFPIDSDQLDAGFDQGGSSS